MKTKVVNRRFRGRPLEVLVVLDNNGISVEVDLNTFIDALVQEAGNPTLLVTKAGLAEKLKAAVDPVCTEIKKASAEVVK